MIDLGQEHFLDLVYSLNIRNEGVERVSHLVAVGRVHQGHVLPLHFQKLTLDSLRYVLNLHHHLIHPFLLDRDNLYLKELLLVLLVPSLLIKNLVHLVHVPTLRHFLRICKNSMV